MAIYRMHTNKNVTVMSSYHLLDKNLSNKAKGLLSVMLSLPENADNSLRSLARICKDGIDGIATQLHELEANGYLSMEQKRSLLGRFTGQVYDLYETPQKTDASSVCIAESLDLPDAGDADARFEVVKSSGYVAMSSYHLHDKNLSNKAKGLLSVMLSLPENWDYSQRGLMQMCTDGREGIATQLHELEANGYLEKERQRNAKGQLGGVLYTVYEVPPRQMEKEQEPGNPGTGNDPASGSPDADREPTSGKPAAENRHRSGKPDTGSRQRTGKPGAENRRRPGKPDAENRRKPGKPGAESGQKSGSPDAGSRQRTGKPGAENRRKPGKPGAENRRKPGKPGAETALNSGNPSTEMSPASGNPDAENELFELFSGRQNAERALNSENPDAAFSEQIELDNIINNIYKNNTSFPFLSEFKIKPEKKEEKRSRYEMYEEIVKENIEYDKLAQDTKRKSRLDEIVGLIVDTVCCTAKTIRVACSDYEADVVKSRFLKLTGNHIYDVLYRLEINTTRIRNIRQYIKAVLFNEPVTMECAMQADYNYDNRAFCEA